MAKRRFSATQSTTIKDLSRVMDKIEATSLRVEQDVMSGHVKVIFDRDGKRYIRECSTWDSSLDNLRAIGLQIEYMYRALEVYGVDMREEVDFNSEFDNIFGGFLAPPDDTALLLGDGGDAWWTILGIKQTASTTDVRSAFRALAKIHHLDGGGDINDFKKLRKAYDEATRAISARN